MFQIKYIPTNSVPLATILVGTRKSVYQKKNTSLSLYSYIYAQNVKIKLLSVNVADGRKK